MAKGGKDLLSNSYRFVEGGKSNAVLDANGKLTILTAGGAVLTVHDSWKDYVKKEMNEDPADGSEDDITEQLSMVLGQPQVVDQKLSGKEAPKQKEENDMKNATATTKKAAAPVAAKKEVKEAKPKAERVSKKCQCGCGGDTFGNFVPGHDARFHGWEKKITRGEMKFSEIPASAAAIMKKAGIVQGILPPKEKVEKKPAA